MRSEPAFAFLHFLVGQKARASKDHSFLDQVFVYLYIYSLHLHGLVRCSQQVGREGGTATWYLSTLLEEVVGLGRGIFADLFAYMYFYHASVPHGQHDGLQSFTASNHIAERRNIGKTSLLRFKCAYNQSIFELSSLQRT